MENFSTDLDPVENLWKTFSLLTDDKSHHCIYDYVKNLSYWLEEEIVNRFFWLTIVFSYSMFLFTQSFQEDFQSNRKIIIETIGKKKFEMIETVTQYSELLRITELLSIDGIGEKTVKKLAQIVGVRFAQTLTINNCYRSKFC